MSIQDGGPAFPSTHYWNEKDMCYRPSSEAGMSLRDYFAGQALIGITLVLHQGIRPTDIEALARDCYGISDAMLKERGQA